MSNNIIKDKSFEFAINIVNICAYLKNQKKEFVLSQQLLQHKKQSKLTVNYEQKDS